MINLFRASGRPVNDPEYYQSMMNNKLDNLIKEHGRDSAAMRKIEPILADLHVELVKEHPIKIEIDYPESEKDLNLLIEKFGALAFCVEDGKIVAYIMDK